VRSLDVKDSWSLTVIQHPLRRVNSMQLRRSEELTVNMLGLHQQRDFRAAEYDRFRAFRLQPIYYLQIRSA